MAKKARRKTSRKSSSRKKTTRKKTTRKKSSRKKSSKRKSTRTSRKTSSRRTKRASSSRRSRPKPARVKIVAPSRKSPSRSNRPILGLFVNLFLPGLGTLISGNKKQGVWQLVLLAASLVSVLTLIGIPAGVIIYLVDWVWAFICSIRLLAKRS